MDQLDVAHRRKKHCLPFKVVKENVSPLLGLVSSELIGLVVRTDEVKEKTLKEEYADVFEGTGKLSMKHHQIEGRRAADNLCTETSSTCTQRETEGGTRSPSSSES